MAQDEQRNRLNFGSNREDSPSKGTPDGESNRPGFSIWIYVAVFLVLLALNFYFWGDADNNQIEYSTFLEYVENGYVSDLTVINDSRVRGRYTQEAVDQAVVQIKEPEGGFIPQDPNEVRRQFTTTKPADHRLTDFLQQYNEKAKAREEVEPVKFTAEQQDDWFSTVFSWVLPIVIIIALWIFLIRRMNPGQQVLNIGKNKAVLFDSMNEEQVDFDDVAGLEEAKEEVTELVEFLQQPDKFTRLGGKIPKGVLLVGPPGTGKTLMAKAVAGEAGVPFFSISGSDFVEMFVGVGAARVRDLFRQAKEKAPCIIFIDEIDAVGRSRGRNMMAGGNDERENTLNQLLVEMDGFSTDKGVIIMAATNRPDMLDQALLRPGRFDRQIMVDKPDRNARRQIFAVHVTELLLGDDVDMDILAAQTPGFAGAEIANVCNEAALLAARKDKDAVEMEDFEQAIDRVIAGLEKKNKIISPEEKEIVAYHESGHAIVAWFLKYTDPIRKVSIVPRGMAALGYAQYLPEERYLYTKEALIDRMTMAIGGRVAEEIVFNRISTGAQNDLERITKMAYAMVVDYGMSERVGQVSFNLSGRDEEQPMFDKPYSEDTARIIDEEVKSIISSVRERARALLEERREKLDEMAATLLEEEVISVDEIEQILGPCPFGKNEKKRINGSTSSPAAPSTAADADELPAPEAAGGDGSDSSAE